MIGEAIAPSVTPAGGGRAREPFTIAHAEAPGSSKPRRWLFPAVITAAAVAVYGIVFLVLIERAGPTDPDPPVVAPTTVNQTGAPTTTATDAPTTTAASPTTTAVPPTTEPPVPTIPPIPAIGEPIDVADLSLGAFTLGPLEFGDGGTDAFGRLVATFGQPDEVWDIGEADGLCPTESGRAARFSWLTVLARNEAGTEVLVGYRFEAPANADDDHPTAGLKTISGAAIGDSLPEWNSIYSTSIVTTDEVDGVQVLLLLRSSDERTLLWGPLTDSDPPLVAGIYSPRPCLGGPLGPT